MNSNPIISILVPTHNRATVFGKTLHSIKNQTFTNWECIVIDDGSTDDTASVMQTFIEQDTRFSYLKNERKKGAPAARNTGLLASTGEYIFFFDSDNILLPNALIEMYEEITKSKSDVCTCYATVLNEKGERTGAFEWNNFGNISEDLLSGKTYVDYNVALIRKDVFERFGLTDEDCPSYQEWDTHLRLSQFCTYSTVQKHLVNYFQGKEGTISSDLKRSVLGYFYNLNKHRALFSKDPDVFKKQGVSLLNTAQLTEDKAFIQDIKSKLITLIPGFGSHLVSHRYKSTFRILISGFKNDMKRLFRRK